MRQLIVTKNATVPVSTLPKKHNSICYHNMRESDASGWISITWIKSSLNLANLFMLRLVQVEAYVRTNVLHQRGGLQLASRLQYTQSLHVAVVIGQYTHEHCMGLNTSGSTSLAVAVRLGLLADDDRYT